MDNNRIGANCWYRTYSKKIWSAWQAGTLRAWSTDHDEYETGPGPFPVGVVEDVDTSHCHSIPVFGICFAYDKPAE